MAMFLVHKKDMAALHKKQDTIIKLLTDLNGKADKIMSNQQAVKDQLAAISANVADEKTVIGSVETLLANLAAQIKALQDAAANADVPQEIVDQISALQTAIDSNKSQLAKDVADNTSPPPVQQ